MLSSQKKLLSIKKEIRDYKRLSFSCTRLASLYIVVYCQSKAQDIVQNLRVVTLRL